MRAVVEGALSLPVQDKAKEFNNNTYELLVSCTKEKSTNLEIWDPNMFASVDNAYNQPFTKITGDSLGFGTTSSCRHQ